LPFTGRPEAGDLGVQNGRVTVVVRRLFSGTSSAARFLRYSAGSMVALAASEAALVLCYGTGLLPAAPASIVAFFVGAVPNYVLNRSWVWKRRGPVRVRAELVPYVLVSVATLVLAALATSFAAAIAPGGQLADTVFVAAAYLVSTTVLFVAKFAFYQKFVFTDGSRTPEIQPALRIADLDSQH